MALKTLNRSNGKEADPDLASDLGATHHKDKDLPIEESSEEKKKRINPLMQGLKPEMLNQPYRIEGTDMGSEEFVCYKISKTIFERLDFDPEKDKKNCERLFKEAWDYFCQQADKDLLAEAKLVADRLHSDKKFLDLVQKDLESRG